MSAQAKLIPIYSSRGEAKAFLIYPYIYDLHGDWIGWIMPDRSVYSVHGHFVGTLSSEPRILRPREGKYDQPKKQSPAPPPRIRPPIQVPLAPMMREVPHNMLDVLEDEPELLPPLDFGELRDDMD